MNYLYITSFCFFFFITYLILQSTRLVEIFKKGSVWQIKVTYLIISFITAYLITQGLINLTQIIENNIV